MNVDDVVAALDADGYCIVEGVWSAADAAAVKAALQPLLAATPHGRSDFEGRNTRRVYALFAKTRTFDEAATHPLLLGVLDRVLQDYWLSAPEAIEIGGGEPAQALHRDSAVYPLPLTYPDVVLNTMWALDDFTVANGATRFVRGSHRWEDRARTYDPDVDEIVHAEMPAGSVAFYTGKIVHGGGANTTSTARLGVILEYVASWLRPQENHLIAVPRDLIATLPTRLQELLGYSIHPPFLGYVDGRHPLRSLDPSR